MSIVFSKLINGFRAVILVPSFGIRCPIILETDRNTLAVPFDSQSEYIVLRNFQIVRRVGLPSSYCIGVKTRKIVVSL
jgi:hypothetical protein